MKKKKTKQKKDELTPKEKQLIDSIGYPKPTTEFNIVINKITTDGTNFILSFEKTTIDQINCIYEKILKMLKKEE